jgi:hypothetical protein
VTGRIGGRCCKPLTVKAAKTLGVEIKAIEKKSTLLKHFTDRGPFDNANLLASHEGGRSFRPTERVVLTEDYVNAFNDYVRSNGQNNASAALYERAGLVRVRKTPRPTWLRIRGIKALIRSWGSRPPPGTT